MAKKGIPKRSDHRHTIGDIEGLANMLSNIISEGRVITLIAENSSGGGGGSSNAYFPQGW